MKVIFSLSSLALNPFIHALELISQHSGSQTQPYQPASFWLLPLQFSAARHLLWAFSDRQPKSAELKQQWREWKKGGKHSQKRHFPEHKATFCHACPHGPSQPKSRPGARRPRAWHTGTVPTRRRSQRAAMRGTEQLGQPAFTVRFSPTNGPRS